MRRQCGNLGATLDYVSTNRYDVQHAVRHTHQDGEAFGKLEVTESREMFGVSNGEVRDASMSNELKMAHVSYFARGPERRSTSGGTPMTTGVRTDSSEAREVASGRGLGKPRHTDLNSDAGQRVTNSGRVKDRTGAGRIQFGRLFDAR